MKNRKLAIGLALLAVCYLAQFTVAVGTRKSGPTKFTVKVENISNPEGMTASNGMKFPFALSVSPRRLRFSMANRCQLASKLHLKMQRWLLW